MPAAPLGLTIPLALVIAALAIVSAIAARAGFAGSLTRSGRMGVHSPAASASDEAFALANRVAAPVVLGAAAIGFVVAIMIVALGMSAALTLVIWTIGLVGVLALLLVAGILGDRAARSVPIPARKPSAACSGCACGGGGCAAIGRTDPAAAAGPA